MITRLSNYTEMQVGRLMVRCFPGNKSVTPVEPIGIECILPCSYTQVYGSEIGFHENVIDFQV